MKKEKLDTLLTTKDGLTRLNLTSAEVQFKLANVWQSKGKMERASAGYQEAIKLQPDYIPAYMELANLLIQQERFDEAIATYWKAIQFNPREICFRKDLKRLLDRKDPSSEESYHLSSLFPILTYGETRSLEHLLFYTDCSGIYGAEQCNHLLMKRLKERGYQITCAQEKTSNYLVDERHQLGIQHLGVKHQNLYFNPPPSSLFEGSGATHLLNLTKPDLIIFSDGCPFSNLAAKHAARELGIAYIMIQHCVTLDFLKPFSQYLNTLAPLYQGAQAVIAVSNENLSLLRQYFGVSENQGEVIFNGRPSFYFTPADPSTRLRIRKTLNIPEEAVLFITVASMEMRKGYQYQLKAIKQLRRSELWPLIHFIWAGTGTLESQLRAVVRQLGASDHVRFLGERSDIPDLLDASDVFLLTSEFEGMPLSVMEAMAKGLPIIATDVSGVSEELGSTGKLLTNPEMNSERTISELVSTIRSWAVDPVTRHKVGQSCRSRAEEMFRSEKMLGQYEKLIKEILQVKRERKSIS